MILDGWYWADTGWACGGFCVCNGVIVEAPPIWRRWIGQPASALVGRAFRAVPLAQSAPALSPTPREP